MPATALSRRVKVRKQLTPVCEKAKATWDKPLLTQYTDHTIEHSKRVIDLLDELTRLLPRPDRLNDNEAYVLLAAALLHDIGMQYLAFFEDEAACAVFSRADIEKALASDDARRDLLRARHHLVGAQWIRDTVGAECIRKDLIEEVAEVVKGHTRVSLDAYEDHRKAGGPMRVRLLAALLRLADELDLDYRRVDLRELDWAPISSESKAHWWRCHYVESVDIDKLGRIQITFRFSNDDSVQVQEIVRSLVLDGVQRTMQDDNTRRMLWNYGVKLDLGDARTLESAKGPSKKPIPEGILSILGSEQDGLARAQLASESRRSAPGDAESMETDTRRRTAVPPSPRSQQSMLQDARNLWAHGAPAQAVESLERATALYPDSAPLQAMLGDLLLSMGQSKAAERAAGKALASEPGSFLAHLTLGVVLGRRGDHMSALQHLRITDLACHSITVPPRYRARVHRAIARSLAAVDDYWYARERARTARNLARGGAVEPADEVDRELQGLASAAEKAASVFSVTVGSWEVAKPRFHDVLGRWAKRPLVRFESLTTLMEGMVLAGSSNWIDYIFECDFQLVNLAAGFLVRSDAWATTGLMLQIVPRKLRRHQMRHSNYFEKPVTEVDLTSSVALYEWHKVRFQISGSTLRTWIDDEPVDEWSDFLPLYGSGKVGFRLWGREFALYRNPRVTVTKQWVRG